MRNLLAYLNCLEQQLVNLPVWNCGGMGAICSQSLRLFYATGTPAGNRLPSYI